jgi:hypothetical protein
VKPGRSTVVNVALANIFYQTPKIFSSNFFWGFFWDLAKKTCQVLETWQVYPIYTKKPFLRKMGRANFCVVLHGG